MSDINTSDTPATIQEALDKAVQYLAELVGYGPSKPKPARDYQFVSRTIYRNVYNLAIQNGLCESDINTLLVAHLAMALDKAIDREMEAVLRAPIPPFTVVTKE